MHLRIPLLVAQLRLCWFLRGMSIFQADRATYRRVGSTVGPLRLGRRGGFRLMDLDVEKYVSVFLLMSEIVRKFRRTQCR